MNPEIHSCGAVMTTNNGFNYYCSKCQMHRYYKEYDPLWIKEQEKKNQQELFS